MSINKITMGMLQEFADRLEADYRATWSALQDAVDADDWDEEARLTDRWVYILQLLAKFYGVDDVDIIDQV